MKLYPAIDILNGRAVRLLYGRREAVTDYGDPVDCARRWLGEGAARLHVVNLSGAFGEESDFLSTLERIAALGIPVQTGGGVRSMQDIAVRIGAGASRVVLGTVCVEQPELLEEAAARWGDAIVAGIDAKEGKMAVRGWTQIAQTDAYAFGCRARSLGIAEAVFTDIGRDGALSGVNLEETVKMGGTGLHIIASGGIRSMEDLYALRARGVYGAVLGRSIYTGAISLARAVEEMEGC